MTFLRATGALCVASFLASTAFADPSEAIQFTVTFHSTATVDGYVNSNSYTAIFTTGAGFTNAAEGVFGSNSDLWGESSANTSGQTLFASIGGTGLTGTYVTPTENPDTTSLFVIEPGSGDTGISLSATNSALTANGLSSTDGSIGLSKVSADVAIPQVDLPFVYSGTPEDIVTAFSGFTGTYTATGSTFSITDVNGLQTGFVIDSLKIAEVSAVPEPKTWALAVSLAALGACVFLKRGRFARV